MKTRSGFDFTIITAVYNTELYIAETIDSVLGQDFGFERIQLILVDDGSTDESGAICDSYQRRYPENITVIHQENAGAASARNAGLEIACGEFVNFLDSDDKLSSNALSLVWEFFQNHGEETDIAVIPLFFFDQQSGPHLLNYKFEKGTRVIDLDEEWDAVQLSSSSCFIKRTLIGDQRFDTRLHYAEDAKLVQTLLMDKRCLGVVAQAQYLYRKRSAGEASMIQKSGKNPDWYFPYLRFFSQELFNIAKKRLGSIPYFIQFAVMYDLQWRISMADSGNGVLDEKESRQYRDAVFHLLEQIDDEVILAQRHITMVQKCFALTRKYGAKLKWHAAENGIFFELKDGNTLPVFGFEIYLDFVTVEKDRCVIEGYVPMIPVMCPKMEIGVQVNGDYHPAEIFDRYKSEYALGEEILHHTGFRVEIPLQSEERNANHIEFVLKIDGSSVDCRQLHFGRFIPLHEWYKRSYYAKSGWILRHTNGELLLSPYGRISHAAHEMLFLLQLMKRNYKDDRKAVWMRLLHHILKPFMRRSIWLVTDRTKRADDNGEAFFEFLMQKKDPRIRPFFVLDKDSPDYERLRAIGPVVPLYSQKHKLMHLLCDVVLSSSGISECINPFFKQDNGYRDILREKKYIFLQHGITKDDLSGMLNRLDSGIYGFVTAALPEYRSIVHGNYHYSKENIWLTGFPRYDRLYHHEENVIALMPTWRKNLVTQYNSRTDTWGIAGGFEQSAYYQFYNSLIQHPRLIAALKEKGYRLLFVPHPNLAPYIDRFNGGECVDFVGMESDVRYREIFAKSRLAITDYSSTVFDFAYLRKPVVYCQFDTKEFFSGSHSYTKGYFDYERDGFGEVTHELEETVDCIIAYLDSDCALKPKYRERIDAFYAYHDQESCQRLFDKLMEVNHESET